MEHPYVGLRQQLVGELRRLGHIRTGLVADAFATVPRHLFAPEVEPNEAYANKVIPLKKEGMMLTSSLSQPAMMAIMLEALALQPGMSVLEIGTGSGYNAALLRQIVGPAGRVVSLDIEADLIELAERQLEAAGYGDVQLFCGDGALGFPRLAPYDRIIVTAAIADVTAAWWSQLGADGRLAVPLVLAGNQQIFVTFERAGAELVSTEVSGTAFIRLRGAHQVAGFKRTFLGPGQGVFVRYGVPPAVGPAQLYAQLIEEVRRHPLQVRVNQSGLRAGLLPWLYLHEPALLHLVALAPAGPFVPPLLVQDKEMVKGTLLLAGADGSAALAPRARVTDRLLKPFDGQSFHLEIWQYGPGLAAGRRLAGLVNRWALKGQPQVEHLRVRAQPRASAGAAPAGVIAVDRPDTRFYFLWAEP